MVVSIVLTPPFPIPEHWNLAQLQRVPTHSHSTINKGCAQMAAARHVTLRNLPESP